MRRSPSNTKPGDHLGRLTAIRLVSIDKHSNAKWLFLCACGNETLALAAAVRSGHTQSCGCRSREIHLEALRDQTLTHGEARRGSMTPEYSAWGAMKARCNRPEHQSFENYGGRGIRVCDEWRNSFKAFLAHVGRRPSEEYSLDRIDNDGNYEPGNVQWATRSQQTKNQRPRKYTKLDDMILGQLSLAA